MVHDLCRSCPDDRPYLARAYVPDKGPRVGGARDLAAGARAVWVIMEHTTRKGTPRLVDVCAVCAQPLTAVRCVKRAYTDLAVIEVTPQGFIAREMLEALSPEHLAARTGAKLTLAPDWRPLTAPPIADAD